MTEAESIAEIMDRHDVSCPLETSSVQREITEFMEQFAKDSIIAHDAELVKKIEELEANNLYAKAMKSEIIKLIEATDDDDFIDDESHSVLGGIDEKFRRNDLLKG